MKKIPMALFASLAMSAANAANHDDNEKLAQLANLAGQWSPISQCALFPQASMATVRDHHEFHLPTKDGQLGEEITIDYRQALGLAHQDKGRLCQV